jgi:hypothetical protein
MNLEEENLAEELRQNDSLPSPFNKAQLDGLQADLVRVQRKYAADDTRLQIETMAVFSTWAARAARKYASDRVAALRAELEEQNRRLQRLEYFIEFYVDARPQPRH